MFRSSTILRELVQILAKVILLLKHSVKLRHCILCGDVAACREMACVLFVVRTAVYLYIPLCTDVSKKLVHEIVRTADINANNVAIIGGPNTYVLNQE